MLELHLSTEVRDGLVAPIDEDWLRCAVEGALIAADVAKSLEIGLVVAGDETVRGLNRDHRGIDSTTDVLAFAFSDAGDEFVLPPGSPIDVGEVIISLPQAQRQAAEHGHTLDRELALLIAHGVLHLLGYDHQEPDDEAKMRTLEAKALAPLDMA